MAPTKPLAGRNAIVTGSGHGIGLAIAERLAREGAFVVMADIDRPAASREALRMSALGYSVLPFEVDVGSEESVSALAALARSRLGTLHILVNDAAILDTTGIEALTLAHFERVLRINLTGAVLCTMALLPFMTAGWGRILNIGSIMGERGQPDSISYSTAKGGIANFTRALAADLGKRGINVNAIAPGFIDTRMAILPGGGHEHDTDWFKDIYLKYGRILLGRPGKPNDIAGPAFFLCSEDSRYVTGQVLLVDGGVSATF
jgi:NAD(P)-dependent dehydrogenase (short-subunit alcohol dehydrogenase family)